MKWNFPCFQFTDLTQVSLELDMGHAAVEFMEAMGERLSLTMRLFSTMTFSQFLRRISLSLRS